MAEKPAGRDPESKGHLAPEETGFDRGHVTAWLRAHGMKNIDENAASVITDASDRVNLRSARR